MNNKNADIRFIHKKLDINQVSLSYWVENDEFATEIRKLRDSGSVIDAQTVFEIMYKIFTKYQELRKVSTTKPDFNYHLAKKGIVSLWFSMTGNKTGWENR